MVKQTRYPLQSSGRMLVGRNMKTSKILIILTILFAFRLIGQSEYSKYIVADSLKKTIYTKNKYGDSKINYLGTIKNSKGDTLYYVFTNFSRVQAAIVMHGHSNIIYLNKKQKEVKSYDYRRAYRINYLTILFTLNTSTKRQIKNKYLKTKLALLYRQ